MEGVGVSLSSPPAPLAALITEQLQNNTAKVGDKDPFGFAFGGDAVRIGLGDTQDSISVLIENVSKKLGELLQEELPEGIRSLNPAEQTAEKTAQRIFDGTTALFGIYAQQNPELEGDALREEFVKTIRGGIKQGYEEALGQLKAIGALGVNGVFSGIEETMRLVNEKLDAYALGHSSKDPDSNDSASEAENTEQTLLTTVQQTLAQNASISVAA